MTKQDWIARAAEAYVLRGLDNDFARTESRRLYMECQTMGWLQDNIQWLVDRDLAGAGDDEL